MATQQSFGEYFILMREWLDPNRQARVRLPIAKGPLAGWEASDRIPRTAA